MKRLTAETLRKLMPVFQWETYKASEDKRQYIRDLILVALHKRKLNHCLLCMNQLIEVINNLEIPMKTHQMNQLYLYSTYQRFQKLEDTKKKIIAILNQEKKKVDPLAAAEWIQQKIDKKQIHIDSDRKKRLRVQSVTQQKRHESKIEKLPSLIGSSSEKLQEELKYLIMIFEEMEQERQNSGLIPLNNENEEDEVEVPCTNIPYDPELYNLNNSLTKLRIKAEDRLCRIIELARDDPRIRKKLEEAIERFQKARIQTNQKIGRLGAIKAHQRLQETKERERRKIKELQLGQNQNLVHASHLYSLLSLPEIKPNRLIF